MVCIDPLSVVLELWRRSHNEFEGPDLHAKDDGLDATAGSEARQTSRPDQKLRSPERGGTSGNATEPRITVAHGRPRLHSS
jgi:hypothetical protein